MSKRLRNASPELRKNPSRKFGAGRHSSKTYLKREARSGHNGLFYRKKFGFYRKGDEYLLKNFNNRGKRNKFGF